MREFSRPCLTFAIGKCFHLFKELEQARSMPKAYGFGQLDQFIVARP